jgi:hypothetical protein
MSAAAEQSYALANGRSGTGRRTGWTRNAAERGRRVLLRLTMEPQRRIARSNPGEARKKWRRHLESGGDPASLVPERRGDSRGR